MTSEGFLQHMSDKIEAVSLQCRDLKTRSELGYERLEDIEDRLTSIELKLSGQDKRNALLDGQKSVIVWIGVASVSILAAVGGSVVQFITGFFTGKH